MGRQSAEQGTDAMLERKARPAPNVQSTPGLQKSQRGPAEPPRLEVRNDISVFAVVVPQPIVGIGSGIPMHLQHVGPGRRTRRLQQLWRGKAGVLVNGAKRDGVASWFATEHVGPLGLRWWTGLHSSYCLTPGCQHALPTTSSWPPHPEDLCPAPSFAAIQCRDPHWLVKSTCL